MNAPRSLPGLRDDLRELAPYSAPQWPARYRLNTNESPYPPPKELVDVVVRRIQDLALNRYPDRQATELRDGLAERVDWPAEGIWLANGSNEVLLHLFLAFGGPGRTMLTFEPTYSMFATIARIASTSAISSERTDGFTIDLDAAVHAQRMKRPEITIVCSPNNPSGNSEPIATVRTLLEETTGLIVVDEAYGEFAEPEESAVPLLHDYPNLVVVKTFSKAWSMAGVRLGYMLAAPELVAQMEKVRLPYHLSSITQAFGEVALSYEQHASEFTARMKHERDRLSVEIGAMGFTVVPSRANFLMFNVPAAAEVWDGLLRRDVLVRRYDDERLSDVLRVTVGKPEENDAFLAALDEAARE